MGITFTKPNPRYQPVSSVNRADLVQDDAVVYNLDLMKAFRIAAGNTALPAAPDATTLGITSGAFGTNSPTLTSTSTNNTSESELARFQVIMPAEYQAGQSITIRVHAKVTATRDTAATLEVLAYESDKEAGISGNLAVGGAQDCNFVPYDDYDFVVTPTTLVAGDTLDCELVAITDDGGGGSGAGHIIIGAIQVLLDIKG